MLSIFHSCSFSLSNNNGLYFPRWAWEAIALLCGMLPGNEAIVGIGANAIILNITSMTYMIYLGLSVSGNVRIGNALGANDPRRAQITSFLALLMGSILSIMNAILLLSLGKRLPSMFTADPEIKDKSNQLLFMAAAFQLPDALYGSVQGIFRGSGRHTLGAKLNFVAYYCIGIPIGYCLGMKQGHGVLGLWMGMTIGLFTVSICGTTFVLRSNWVDLAFKARDRFAKY